MRNTSRSWVTAVFAAASLCILGTGCDDESPVSVNNGVTSGDGKYVGSITGRVISAQNSAAIAAATIIITGDIEGDSGASRTLLSDANGYYQFENLRLGDYQVTVMNTATQAGARSTVTIEVPNGYTQNPGNTTVRVNEQQDFVLLPLSADLTGSVLVQKDKPLAKALANNFAAESVLVEIIVPGVIPSSFTTYTNAGGQFSFDNLPANALSATSATLICHSFTDNDGTVFSEESVAIDLLSGSNTPQSFIMDNVANALLVLKTSLDGLAANSLNPSAALRIILSDSVDGTRLTSVRLQSGTITTPVLVTAQAESVTVTPVTTLTAGTSYTLTFTLYSSDGRSTGNQTRVFSTIKGLELLETSYQSTDRSDLRIGLSDNITLTFTRAPRIDSLETRIGLIEGSSRIVLITSSVAGNVLTIDPSAALQEATTYVVYIVNLKSSVAGDNFSLLDTAYTVLPAAPVGAVTGLALNVVDFKADYNTTSIPVKWNRSSDASSYHVYVKNTVHPAWILFTGNSGVGDNFSTTQRHTVSLNNSALDVILSSTVTAVQPFAQGSVCSLMVVPVNVNGLEGGLATAAKLGLRDLVQPTIFNNALFTTKSDADMDNISGTAKTVSFSIEFSEYMNTSITPSIGVISGAPTVTFTNVTWDETEGSLGKNRLSFDMTIPNTVNLDTRQLSISGIKDQSENSIDASVVITLSDI